MIKRLSDETIQKIRDKVLKGKSKCSIAKEFGVTANTVCKYTGDLQSSYQSRPCIRGKSLELLQQLIRDGYIYSSGKDDNHRMYLRELQNFFPEIKRSQFQNRVIFYLEDKNKLALHAFINRMDARVINYHDLAQMSNVFDVNLSGDDKQNLIGRKNNQIFPTIRRKDGGFLSSYDETQMSLDDFSSETAFLGNFRFKKHRKKHNSENDSLLENGDSLVDFCIRKYCHERVLYNLSVSKIGCKI